MKKFGTMNLMSTNEMNTIRKFLLLERLYKGKKITNYTDDCWLCVGHSEWQPLQYFIENTGVNLDNEYSRTSG